MRPQAEFQVWKGYFKSAVNARALRASGWSTPANLPGGANADVPQVGIDAKGNTFVAWTCPVDGGRTLCISRYTHASASWESVQHPDDYNQFSNGFALSVASSGEALAIYLHSGSTGAHDVVAQRYSGGSWAPELIVAEPNSAGVTTPVVTMAAGGLAVAAFNGPAGLNVATRSGSTWTVASSNLPSAEFGLAATINDAGDVLVGFMDSTTQPKTYQYDATGKAWTGPTARSSAGESSAYGQCPEAKSSKWGRGKFTYRP
jgi:hypothetical protein